MGRDGIKLTNLMVVASLMIAFFVLFGRTVGL